MSNFAVRMLGIDKSFGAVKALQGVDFEVQAQTIHALVGENGAGKTTLMRILYGAVPPSSGSLEIFGERQSLRSAADGISHGIGMVSQHYSIIPELTCLQNLMLGAEPGFIIDESQAIARAESLAKQMGFQFSWKAGAGSLSPAGAQKLEILKLLWRDSKILILDEPTAMLSPADSDSLFVSLKKLVDRGSTVIVVTHRLPEVLQYCQEVTVLRGGRKVAHSLVSDVDATKLAELIVGHSIPMTPRAPFASRVGLLAIQALTVKGDRGDDAVKSISLIAREGEMVGIAGVDGSGQRELFQCLLGMRPAFSGTVTLNSDNLLGDRVLNRIQKGVRIIPEDRHEEGVVDDWSLVENVALGLQRLHPLQSRGWIDAPERRSLAKTVADLFATKHGGIDQPMRSLSGGNQQRFVAARALQLAPKLILAFQPSRGLDIDGSHQVFSKIREQCRGGATALVVSFDLDELIEECDRVVAMNNGHLAEPPPDKALDRAEIGRLMVGAA